MTDNDPTRGIDLNKQPHSSIIKRIDIGLTTGLCALLLSCVGVITSRASYKMNQETQKARVLPIIDIDMGYTQTDDGPYFQVKLNNVGAGIAHVQTVTPLKNNTPIADLKTFEDGIMTGRMRSWATLTSKPAAGYIRAGDSVTPVSYRMGSAANELKAYQRGEWGVPMEGLDLEVCYCSVFKDCWTVKYANRQTAKPVKSCGISDVPEDMFQNYIDQTAKARIEG